MDVPKEAITLAGKQAFAIYLLEEELGKWRARCDKLQSMVDDLTKITEGQAERLSKYEATEGLVLPE
jgi:hypothetical protein